MARGRRRGPAGSWLLPGGWHVLAGALAGGLWGCCAMAGDGRAACS